MLKSSSSKFETPNNTQVKKKKMSTSKSIIHFLMCMNFCKREKRCEIFKKHSTNNDKNKNEKKKLVC